MAKLTFEIIHTLRTTADQLENTTDYQWGHMGSCNCGFLGQQVTRLDKREIHRRAMQRYGDWNDQLNDYCPTSGLPFDDIISSLLGHGFDIGDLRHLEKLSDPKVLRELPPGTFLRHNLKQDVVLYMRTWADLIENTLVGRIQLRGIFDKSTPSVSTVST